MKMFSDKKALTYDDVVIVPQYSEIDSRNDIDITTDLDGLKLSLPVISANMDTVTTDTMCEVMFNNGGLGVLHRFASDEMIISWMEHLLDKKIVFGASVGVNRNDDHLLKLMLGKAIGLVCIDVAHGHHAKVKQRIRYIKSFNSDVVIMAGNVCTLEGAQYLAEAGANVLKVGVGPGSLCRTRLATGCGLPQLTAVSEVYKVKREYPNVSIVADGGIKNAGDVCKSLAAGADAVMIGNLLAGTKASPGETTTLGSFQRPSIYKHYRGSASMSCKVDNGKEPNYIEGTTSLVPYRGKAESVLGPIADGLRSGMSYVGAKNLHELRQKAVFAEITSHGYIEGTPHGVSDY